MQPKALITDNTQRHRRRQRSLGDIYGFVLRIALSLLLLELRLHPAAPLRDGKRPLIYFSPVVHFPPWIIGKFYSEDSGELINTIAAGSRLHRVLFLAWSAGASMTTAIATVNLLIEESQIHTRNSCSRRPNSFLATFVALLSIFLSFPREIIMVTTGLPADHLVFTTVAVAGRTMWSPPPFVLIFTFFFLPRRPRTFLGVSTRMAVFEEKEPVLGIGSLITSIDPTPINVNGHFNDIFLGYHRIFGQVALRRPRTSERNHADTIRVRRNPLRPITCCND